MMGCEEAQRLPYRQRPTKVTFKGLATIRSEVVACEPLRRHSYVDRFRGLTPSCSSSACQVSTESLPKLVEAIGPDASPSVLKMVRQALCSNLEERASLVMPKVPELVRLLRSASPESQFEAAWILTNLISYGAADGIVHHGGVRCFVDLLTSASAAIRSQAVWAIGNLAGVSETHRDEVLRCDVLPLLHGLRDITLSWSLCNLVRGTPPPEKQHAEKAIPLIGPLLDEKDPEVVSHAIWALCYLAEAYPDVIQRQCTLLERALSFARHENSAQLPAIRILMRSCGFPSWIDHFRDALLTCRTAGKIFILRRIEEECRRNPSDAAESIVPLLPLIAQCMHHGVSSRARLREQWIDTVGSIIQTTSTARRAFVEYGCGTLIDILGAGDVVLKLKALEVVKILLDDGYSGAIEMAGGLQALETLEGDEDDQVYAKALELLEMYFPDY